MGWFDEIEDRIEHAQFETREVATAKLADLAMRYFRQGIACPFLENESCSIHESRPLACREYLVTSPAENCSAPSAETIRMVDVFLKPSRSLRNITKTGQLKGIKFLPLIRALDIAESFPEQFAEKTGQEWMSDFFDDVSANQKAEGSHKVA
jgi:Fe-S-cluster containining protein